MENLPEIMRQQLNQIERSEKPSDSHSENRRNWLRETHNRWQVASGAAPIDLVRLKQIANELDIIQYSEAQAKKAEQWILKGAPCIYGKLTFADFFPTDEQLDGIGYVTPNQRTYREGFEDGKLQERGEWEANESYLKLVKETSEAVDLDLLKTSLASREESLNERERLLEIREQSLNDKRSYRD